MFGQTNPYLEKSKDGNNVSSLDLNNTTFVNTDTQEKLTYDEFEKEIQLGNGEKIPLIPLGELGPDNILAYGNPTNTYKHRLLGEKFLK
jgi:hypothetical protein